MGKSKGTGGDGCCCGGCWDVPADSEVSSTARVIEVQQYCCRCIPRFLCVTVTDGDTTQSTLIERTCSSGGADGPVQFRGVVQVGTFSGSMQISLEVRSGQCWIVWTIASLSLGDEKQISQTTLPDEGECDYGMKQKDCVEFGGTWTIGEGQTLTIAMPDVLDIATLIECAGCRCLPRCFCMSIYSRDIMGEITYVGSNVVTCATLEREPLTDCGDPDFYPGDRYAQWAMNGWNVVLRGGFEPPPASATVITGTARSLTPCTLTGALMFGDEFEHIIDASGGSVAVTYFFSVADRTGLKMRWAGRSHNAESTTTFAAWNWTTSSWDTLGSVAGRAAADTINRTFRSNLTTAHTGTGANVGQIRIRITAASCTELHSDVLRVVTDRCCKLELIPPQSVTPTTSVLPFDLSQPGNCPFPNPSWTFNATDGKEYVVGLNPAWCGGICGGVSTNCCDRPIPTTVFADVWVDCPGCTGIPVTVALTSSTGAIWEGTGTMCGSPVTVRLSCVGATWQIFVEGAGACSFTGNAISVTCTPLSIVFQGMFAGGIGCCGVGSMDTSVAITVTVVE